VRLANEKRGENHIELAMGKKQAMVDIFEQD
jgi:hypothetical protein